MGQYYRPVLKINNGIEILNRNLIIDGQEEYMMAKLTEHSWIGNWLMETVCDKIYISDKPVRLIWMGDYADDFANDLENTFNGLTKKQIINYRNAAWGEPDRSKAVERAVFDFEGKYIVNHTKKEYVDFSLYSFFSCLFSNTKFSLITLFWTCSFKKLLVNSIEVLRFWLLFFKNSHIITYFDI